MSRNEGTTMGRIILVPTSHIAAESLRQIRDTIEKEKPECIAVELDLHRFYGMKAKPASTMEAIRALGFSTFLIYAMMKRLQQWLGKKVGILPGSDMLQAVAIGDEKKLKVAFIDQDIRFTFARMQAVPLSEKFKLVWYLVKGVTIGLLLSKIKKTKGIDLRKVPEESIINQAMTLFAKEFPHLFAVLVTERDKVMAKKLHTLSPQFKTIVAVIGAGHEKGMRALLQKPQN